MTDRHARWLAERLPEWEREGLVSPEAARTLRERYREVPAAGLAQIVIGAIGGLFIGAGLIAVLAYNWDDLSRPARMTLALLPLAVTQAISAWLILRGGGAKPWMREAAALAQTAAVGGAMALVSQIYHLPGQWTEFLFWWCVASVPLVWVMQARGVAVAYLLGIAVWAIAESVEGAGLVKVFGQADLRLWYPLLLAGILPLWPGLDLRGRPSTGLGYVLAGSALAGLLAVAGFAARGAGEEAPGFFWMAMLSSAAVMLFPLDGERLADHVARKPHLVVGGLALVGMALAATFEPPAKALVTAVGPALREPWCWVLLAAVAGFGAIAFRQGRFAVLAVAALAAVPAVLAPLSTADDGWLVAIAYSLLVLATAAVLIGLELMGRQGAARIGAALATILVMLRMADADLSLLTKGIAFILLGSAFLAFNLSLGRLRGGAPGGSPS